MTAIEMLKGMAHIITALSRSSTAFPWDVHKAQSVNKELLVTLLLFIDGDVKHN